MTHWTKENQIDAPYTHAFLNKGTLNMKGFLCGTVVKNPPISAAYARDVSSIPGSGRHPGVGNGNPLQYLAWKTPRTEEPGRLQSMGSQRVGHHWAHMHAPLTWAPNNIQPTQASEHIYMTVVISSKISSVVTATSHSNDPAPNGQKPQSGSLGRVPRRHLRGRWEDFFKDFLITMAKIKQLLIYTPCLTVFSMTFLWSWKLYKCSQWLIKTMAEDFPGETVDKTLPANAGDMGWPLIQEDSTCLRTAQPVYHNYWNWALKSRSHNYWAYVPQQLKPPHPRANAPQ